mmetsp:Transcript_29449/g.86042  ORF Transcript_29449/g.86042 Transcript_29449/m.86042 type:complete len:155 (+) Transcript_29449:163-627(+)
MCNHRHHLCLHTVVITQQLLRQRSHQLPLPIQGSQGAQRHTSPSDVCADGLRSCSYPFSMPPCACIHVPLTSSAWPGSAFSLLTEMVRAFITVRQRFSSTRAAGFSLWQNLPVRVQLRDAPNAVEPMLGVLALVTLERTDEHTRVVKIVALSYP